jgi:hypothetical protein
MINEIIVTLLFVNNVTIIQDTCYYYRPKTH